MVFSSGHSLKKSGLRQTRYGSQKIQTKSQTGRLYQHPTPENTIKNKKSGLLIPALIVIAMCLAGVVNCAGYQNAVAKMGVKQ